MNNDKTRLDSLENDCHNYEKRIQSLKQEVHQGEQLLKECNEELSIANDAVRNYQVKCNDLDKEIERLETMNRQNDGEHDKKMAESSTNLQVLEKQIREFKEIETEKIKEISELKKVNSEWEKKTKEILYEIQ